MQTISRTVTVQKPLDVVWNYLSDFRSTNDWDPGTVETVRTHGDGGTGTVYHNTSKFLGKTVEIDYTVVEHSPQRKLKLHADNGSVQLTDTLTFQHADGATTVGYEAVFEFQGLAKAVDPLAGPPLKKLGDDAEDGLRTALEGL